MRATVPDETGRREYRQTRREQSVCDSEKTEKELRETERERESE